MELKDVQSRIGELKRKWGARNIKFREWYQILLMEDTLKVKNMESFVSNDPKTAHNLARHLLTPDKIPFGIPVDPINLEEIPESSEVERGLTVVWDEVDNYNRERGRKGWMEELISFLLTTGWYAVFVMVQKNSEEVDECIAEIWNPHDVYPHWSNRTGLVEVVHSYVDDRRSLAKCAADYGYSLAHIPTNQLDVTCDEYWYYGDDGGIYHCIVAGNGYLKPPTRDNDLKRIPVVVSPVGGLPDRGSIVVNDDWMKHVGEALVATNELVYKSLNRQMTFMQQLLRDTAQPISVEKTSGQQIIKDPEDLYKRGAHFRLSQNDDLGFLTKPAIPVELTRMLFETGNMVQRGSLPWAMFGNIQQQVTGYLISQISSTAQQSLNPYAKGAQYCLADICNLWLTLIARKKARPWGMRFPTLPAGMKVRVDLRIHIPGDLTQRVNTARMMNPEFKLSEVMVLDLLFPEVQNPLHEQARRRSETAMNHPVAVQIDLIRAFKQHSAVLRKSGDHEGAANFEYLANVLNEEIKQVARPQGRGQQSGVVQPYNAGQQVMNPSQEVLPRQMMEDAAGGPSGISSNGTGGY